jgi:methyl-accepting chemotaxis protein
MLSILKAVFEGGSTVDRKITTLRTRLLVSFIVAALVPLIVATSLAVPWFRSSIDSEAQRTLDKHATVASQLFAERVSDRGDQAGALARILSDSEMRASDRIDAELRRQVSSLGLTYAFFLDTRGVIRGTTSGEKGRQLDWPMAQKVADGQRPVGVVAIVPEQQLRDFDKASAFSLTVLETEGGSAAQQEADGALSIVSAAPVTDERGARVGAVVTVSVMKKDNSLVDSVVAKVGGVSTVFQNGVRISTTVKNDAGERAIGTAISDKVRAAVLDTGKPYRGEAFVVNRPYFTFYEPLLDPDGTVVGMLFVGLDQAPYKKASRDFALAMGMVIVLGIGIALGFGFLGSQQMSAPFIAVGDAAEQVAAGDLTVVVPQSGFREARAMGGAFNTMIQGLHTLIRNVSRSVKSLETVAHEVASASAVEAESATSQASAVSEATATIEELDRSFLSVADGAKRVLEIAEDSLEVADSGRDTVEDSAGNISRLANGATATLQAAECLAEMADDIDQVTFVIGSIAEQTKILALNAAIEAARAGDAGKGFGVVATEIRSLADSVSTSVGRIEELVRTIQGATKTLAATAEQQAELGESTVADSNRTRDKFDEILERMNRTASAAREIATAAAQQRSAAQQIVQVMHQVSEGVTSTASASRQLATAAGDIQREAGSLSGGLRGFKVD